MNALLDTSVFLWAIDEYETLSKRAREAIEDSGTNLSLSVASLWEIVLKASKGKLFAHIAPTEQASFLDQHIAGLGVTLLPLTRSHVFAVTRLPPIHKDPFDRLLIAQAIVEGMTFISRDRLVRAYPVKTLW